MKKSLITIALLVQATVFTLFAQNQVYTFNCTPVDYKVYSPGNIAQLEADAAAYISNRGWTSLVTKVDLATGEYNGHSYAWNITTAGHNTYWINAHTDADLASFNQNSPNATPPPPSNIAKYWTDGSYSSTTEGNSTKVVYGALWYFSTSLGRWDNLSDHSANRATTGKYTSKWNLWGTYMHDYDKCPYYVGNSRFYYKPNVSVPSYTITGPDRICVGVNVQYTISPTPQAITWSVTNMTIVSGQNSTTVTVKHNSSVTTNGTIKATVNHNWCTLRTDSKYIGLDNTIAPPPISNISGPLAATVGVGYKFTAIGSTPNVAYEWVVSPSGTVYNYGNWANIYFNHDGYFKVSCRTASACGPGPWIDIYVQADY